MHLLPISLLTILAGTLLLAKFRKEPAGKIFAVISWFFIAVGFILFIGFIGAASCRMSHRNCMEKPGCRHEMMMKECNHGMRGGMCCPEGMGKGKCSDKPGCMGQDSTMKGCTMHMKADSVKK
jgi:hypothetical protein